VDIYLQDDKFLVRLVFFMKDCKCLAKYSV